MRKDKHGKTANTAAKAFSRTWLSNQKMGQQQLPVQRTARLLHFFALSRQKTDKDSSTDFVGRLMDSDHRS